jgi:hypothetical protein
VAIRIGNTTPLEPIDEEIEFDLQHGVRITLIYEGDEASMKALAAQFSAGNARAARHDGPVWRTRVTGGPELAGGGDPSAVEKWSLKSETVQVDIRNNPKLIQAAGNETTLAKWVKECKDTLKDPAGTPLPVDSDPNKQASKQALFELMARGTDSYEVSRPVLVERLIKPLSQLHQLEIWAVPVFYSTTALVSNYGIPTPLATKLPPNPATKPSNTQWGWKERDNEEDITPVYNKVEHVRMWAFAAWSTLMYDYVQ